MVNGGQVVQPPHALHRKGHLCDLDSQAKFALCSGLSPRRLVVGQFEKIPIRFLHCPFTRGGTLEGMDDLAPSPPPGLRLVWDAEEDHVMEELARTSVEFALRLQNLLVLVQLRNAAE